MVFCGKPSRGCATCRTRKIKCDQSEPSCRRCLTTGRTCPGYRIQQDLVFRDENSRTISRAQRAKARSDVTASKRPDRMPEELTTKAVVVKSQIACETAVFIPPILVPPIEDQANWFFFNNYYEEGAGFYKGSFTDLPSIYSQLEEGNALSKAITSVGLASLSNIRNDPRARVSSRREYVSAIRLVNAALADPLEVKKDQTILAVMLLGLYEIITCDTPQSMTTWIKHVNGAIAILQSHDNQVLRSKSWIRIFFQLRYQAITGCLQIGVAVHPKIIEWCRKLRTFETVEERPVNEVTEILIRLCSVRAFIREGGSGNPAACFSSLLSVDAELAGWFKRLPPAWAYTTVAAKPNDSNYTYADHYHIYQSLAIAGILNSCRCTRVMIHERILEFFSAGQTPTSADLALLHSIQREASKTVVSDLVSEICASVPYYFGFHDHQHEPSYTPKALGGYIIRWPLFIVASTSSAPDSMREWAIAQLQRITYTMGIKQTMAMAIELKAEMKQ